MSKELVHEQIDWTAFSHHAIQPVLTVMVNRSESFSSAKKVEEHYGQVKVDCRDGAWFW